MANLDAKFIIENSGEWSKITVDSVDYVIRFDIKNGEDESDEWHSISCWISDFSTMWTEVIEADSVIKRLKDSNRFLACDELMMTILSTITAVPENEIDLELTALNENENDIVHLHAKYYLADGSDQIPLKFYWSLEKCCIQTFYENFINFLLVKIIDLQKANDSLSETIRQNDEKCDNLETTLREMTSSVGVREEGNELNGLDDSVSVNTDPGVCHEGLTCNNCLSDIYGNRYNCVECEDYDLCMPCEQTQVHTHHIMVRYAKPDDNQRSELLFQKQDKPKISKRKRISTS